MSKNYRWERCYETCEGRKLWAIVDDDSKAKRSVTDWRLVVNHEWAESTHRPFPECELPQRIIQLLNDDEDYFASALHAMRNYTRPADVNPFSADGMLDLELQCGKAADDGDSSLLEMACLALRHWRVHGRTDP